MAFRGTLIASGQNAKTIKGDKEYETAIMYLAPHKNSGAGNVCAMAELAGCTVACLYRSGRGGMSSVQQARINKTIRYYQDRAKFMADLVLDIEKFVRYCDRKGVLPAVRLNGTSDIQWEKAHPCYRDGDVKFAHIFEAFPEVQFYDYTKLYNRAYWKLPRNYHLVLSYSGASKYYSDGVTKAYEDNPDVSMAIVYRTKELVAHHVANPPSDSLTTNEYRVIDGDETDLRFLDPKGCIVGLYAKGPAKKDYTGFVVDSGEVR